MSKEYNLIDTNTGTFAGWLTQSNDLFEDMSNIIVTVSNTATYANITNNSTTTGNGHIEGAFSAVEMVIKTALHGGDATNTTDGFDHKATLFVTSNVTIGTTGTPENLIVWGDSTLKDDVTIGTATSDALVIEATTTFNGPMSFNANVQFNDNKYLKFGTSGDASVQWDGSNLYTKFETSNANFVIEDFSGNDIVDIDVDSSTLTIARYDDEVGGPSLVLLDEGTTIDNANVGGIFFKGQDDTSGIKEYAAIKGVSEDVSKGTEDGSLLLYTTIANTSTAMIVINENSNAEVSLRHNGDEKLKTQSDGVDIIGIMSSNTIVTTGLADVNSLDVTGNADIGGNLTVQGDFLATGDTNMTVNNATFTTMTVIGDATLGNQLSDTVTINATVTLDGDIIPGNTGINGYDLGNNASRFVLGYFDDLTITANVNLQGQGSAVFWDSDTSHYLAFKSAGTVSANVIWTLPNADATTAGYSLQSNASGTLSWGPSSSTTTADEASNSEEYIYFSDYTSGAVTTVHHDTGLRYNPSLGRITTASANVATLYLNGSQVTSTAAELNALDGITSTVTELNIVDGSTSATSTTLANADRLIVNDAGTMKQVALTDFNTYFTNTFLTGGSADIKTAGDLTFNDGVALNLGSQDDLEFYHSGTHGYIDINTGSLYVRDASDNVTLQLTPSSGSPSLLLNSHSDGAEGPDFILRHDMTTSGSAAADDETGNIFFQADDSADNNTTYAQIVGRIVDPTNTSEDGSLLIYTLNAGSQNVTISANSGVAALYYGGSAKLTTASGGVTITGTATATTFSGALSGNATTASAWQTARTLTLSGAVTGSASIDGSGNISLATTATSDPTLTLSGDVSGSATFTNLGNATLSVSLGAGTVNSNELASAVSLVIYNSAGAAVKTLYGAGS